MSRIALIAGASALALTASTAVWADDVTLPAKSFDVRKVLVTDVVGELKVTVGGSGPVTVRVSGDSERVKTVQLKESGGRLTIDQERSHSVWNWHKWFDFDEVKDKEGITVRVEVPKGTELTVDDFVGDADIGDLEGPLKFSAAAVDAKIGKVTTAELELAGAGDIEIAEVSGTFTLEIAGSGDVRVGSTGGAKVEIAGSGEANIGAVAGGVRVAIAGSGDVTVASVSGPVDIDIAGAGSVTIQSGEANPLSVDIMGSGDLVFGGEAVDPKISAFGSGDVRIKSYRGKLQTNGQASLTIGD